MICSDFSRGRDCSSVANWEMILSPPLFTAVFCLFVFTKICCSHDDRALLSLKHGYLLYFLFTNKHACVYTHAYIYIYIYMRTLYPE